MNKYITKFLLKYLLILLIITYNHYSCGMPCNWILSEISNPAPLTKVIGKFCLEGTSEYVSAMDDGVYCNGSGAKTRNIDNLSAQIRINGFYDPADKQVKMYDYLYENPNHPISGDGKHWEINFDTNELNFPLCHI